MMPPGTFGRVEALVAANPGLGWLQAYRHEQQRLALCRTVRRGSILAHINRHHSE